MSKRGSYGNSRGRYSSYEPSAEVTVPNYRGKTLAVPNTGLSVIVWNNRREMYVKLQKPRSQREISLKIPEFEQLTTTSALDRIFQEIASCEEHIKKYHPEGAHIENYTPEEVETLPTQNKSEIKRIKLDKNGQKEIETTQEEKKSD